MSLPLVIIGIILFIGLIVVHELGHFIAARRNGVEVEEFGIGFPPRAWSKRMKGGYDFSINWLPLGGFVRLKGEHDADTEKGTFGAASSWTKIKIMVAGVVMNAVTAFVMLTLLALWGMPRVIDNQFTIARDTKVVKSEVLAAGIEEDSPAAKSNMKEQDVLTEFLSDDMKSYPVTSADDLPAITQKLAGQMVLIKFKRGGELHQERLQLRSQQEVEASKVDGMRTKGYIGIIPADFIVQRSTWSAPIVAAGLMKQITIATFQGLGTALNGLFHGDTAKASSQVSGVVGIGYILTKGSILGAQFILFIVAIISLTLAIMNVLPIPALDGGRLFVTLLFRAIKKPLTPRLEEWIHGTGFALLMVLFVLITIVDIKRFL
jgi:regulator of sigma E protease